MADEEYMTGGYAFELPPIEHLCSKIKNMARIHFSLYLDHESNMKKMQLLSCMHVKCSAMVFVFLKVNI